MSSENIIVMLKNGGVGVVPTDTIYGIVGSARSKKTVERIYKLRARNTKKPMIVLIDSMERLKEFDIEIDARLQNVLKKIWPGPVSVILPCPHKKFEHLHRGTNAIAFRVPKSIGLRKLLQKTGPLVASSANKEGMLPAKTIAEARAYFGESIDFYKNGGVSKKNPSILIEVKR